MQNILTRLRKQLEAKGMSYDKAHSLAVETLQNSGSLYRGTETLTPKGIERTRMGAAGRAIDREVQRSGRPASDYKYNPRTNRATLK